MNSYSFEVKQRIRALRKEGYTYTEIQVKLRKNIPKGTLSYICKDIVLTSKQQERIRDILQVQLAENRKKAVIANREVFSRKIRHFRSVNLGLIDFMKSRDAKLVALAMLYLGEGAKWKGRRGLHLGSSDPAIVNLYIDLLRECYNIPLSSLKCRVQHRADQNGQQLMRFWSNTTGVPLTNFYPNYIDKRTIGKITRKKDYKGVCGVSCAGTHVQLELEQIAGIISDALTKSGSSYNG